MYHLKLQISTWIIGVLLRQTAEAALQITSHIRHASINIIECRQAAVTPVEGYRRFANKRQPFVVQSYHSSARQFSSAAHHKMKGASKFSMVSSLSPFLPMSDGSLSAALLLVSSSIMGMWADKEPRLQGSGILVTLLVAAMFSNQGLVPINHPLYDLAWTKLLPTSLALLLMASSRPLPSGSSTMAEDTTMNNVLGSIRRVGVAFIVGCFGSILGCVGSFWACRRRQLGPSLLTLAPRQAALAAGCLCASYIGGSVNFFATARIITSTDSLRYNRSSSSSLLGAMATADLVVMAIYFALMASAVQSKTLQSLFASDSKSSTIIKDRDLESTPAERIPPNLDVTTQKKFPSIERRGLASVLVSALAFAVVTFATKADALFSTILPGTACAIIALVAPLLSGFLNSSSRESLNWSSLWSEMQNQARWLSEFTFHCLFAAIGASANLGNVLKAGPACLIFSLMALVIHVVVIVAGSWGLKQCIPGFPRISLNEVLVASNAAIGGPATAATFAGRLQPQADNRSSNTSFGLTMAATFWGVVGYAIGTVIGTQLTQILRRGM